MAAVQSPVKFRVRTVHDYDHIPRGLGRTEMELKMRCCLIGMQKVEETLGKDHELYIEFQSRAIAWASR